jgi:hypothetical protein
MTEPSHVQIRDQELGRAIGHDSALEVPRKSLTLNDTAIGLLPSRVISAAPRHQPVIRSACQRCEIDATRRLSGERAPPLTCCDANGGRAWRELEVSCNQAIGVRLSSRAQSLGRSNSLLAECSRIPIQLVRATCAIVSPALPLASDGLPASPDVGKARAPRKRLGDGRPCRTGEDPAATPRGGRACRVILASRPTPLT